MDRSANFSVPEINDDFREHFHAIYGTLYTDEQIRKNVYGGLPLVELYESITFSSSATQLEDVRATLTLNPAVLSPLPPLEIRNVSLAQFLVSGFPLQEWYDAGYLDESERWVCCNTSSEGDCLSRDYWELIDAQYRLELCHSEISRWSIFFKQDGDKEPRGGADIPQHHHFGRIELVNNCTNTQGFEFRLTYGGLLYHGSFGAGDPPPIQDLYTALSERQAGSLAKQDRPATIIDQSHFWEIYNASLDKGPNAPLDPTFDIQLENRYGLLDTSFTAIPLQVKVELGQIDYQRWGSSSEYFQKAMVRRLMYRIVDSEGHESKKPPAEYAEIRDAQFIELPEFQPTGIYDFTRSKRLKKQGQRWLFDIERSMLQRLSDGRYMLALLRDENEGQFELRRIVIGNISLKDIPIYPKLLTIDRFGYGARKTSQDYDSDYKPQTDPAKPALYSYLLAGTSEVSASKYITPESFGIERLILSRDCHNTRHLVIDLISFERILPLWQGVIELPEEVLE